MLNDTVHIVTGGGGGLGTAVAEKLASEGATVVVNDLGPETSDPSAEAIVHDIVDEGGDAEIHYGDVTDTAYAERLVEETVEKYGRVDGVVNFAGILQDSYLTNMSGEEWDQVVHVHLRGHFALLRAAGRHWKERAQNGDENSSSNGIGDRTFLAVSSPSVRGNIGQANYAAAKAGVLGLVRTSAAELRQYGVRVNALVPVAHTAMTESFLDADEYPAEKVAPVAAYLLSEAGEGVTGCTVRAAGDGIALLTNPEVERVAFNQGGWDLDSLTDRFEATLGSDLDLDRSEPPSW